MNFLALILGLAVERLLTHLFHLREFHWLDPLYDKVFGRLGSTGRNVAVASIVMLTLLLTLPVAFIQLALLDRFAQIPAFVFAVVVLLFCLGPRDLVEEVEDYRSALARDDHDELSVLSRELFEYEVVESANVPDIEQAIYAQANNRIFAVVFWFIMFGAVGAWLFRVLDLMRRRAIRKALAQSGDSDGESAGVPRYVQAVLLLHRIMAWVPARLLMMGYVLAGSYDSAMLAWRGTTPDCDQYFPREDDALLGAIGRGAAPERDADDVSARAQVAIELVTRTLWMIWCPALALMTLYDWIN
jgi:membrane protein required for beta-lactamase induction